MREIKFRAWDKEEEMMLNDVSLQNETWDMMNELFRNEDSLSFMQYTGLKDKNGVEIYEGDIVLCKIYSKEYVGLVEYTDTYGFYYLSGMGRSDTELWGCNEREIIGNIYENPELLERDN